MKFLLTAFFTLSFFSGVTFADTAVGNVGSYRTFPAAHGNASVRNHVVFNIQGQSLNYGCAWLYLAPEDTSSVSLLLAAKIAKQPVIAVYGSEHSPWHTGTCKATEIMVE